jgi:hypothetical protein
MNHLYKELIMIAHKLLQFIKTSMMMRSENENLVFWMMRSKKLFVIIKTFLFHKLTRLYLVKFLNVYLISA